MRTLDMPLNGQWLGDFEIVYPDGMVGPGKGPVTADIDERESFYEGIVHLYYGDPVPFTIPGLPEPVTMPPMDIQFKTENKEDRSRVVSTHVGVLDQRSGRSVAWEAIQDRPANILVASKIEGMAERRGDQLEVTWTTDIRTKGRALLHRSKAGATSELGARTMDWYEFKRFVSNLELRGKMFRGQRRPWRLRTSYHRLGRANLARYLNEDIRSLHLALSARTKHFFNLSDPEQNGAFLNLAQHHGYPTPLLDWTYSPYVAAFFAFRGMTREDALGDEQSVVRIIVFDHARWKRDIQQVPQLVVGFPHVSMLDPLALENDRLVPQQSSTMLTNVDDIEGYIGSKTKPGDEPYLTSIDIPWSERDRVIPDLHHMGITAGSMFPGLDGTCEELKERNFLVV
jgi:hypothetical protein